MMWSRVFGGSDSLPAPADIAACLAGAGGAVSLQVQGDEAGWYHLEIRAGETILELERWLLEDEGIRAELNSWAAVVEAGGESPQHEALMERIIQTRQLFTLASAANRELTVRLCRHLALGTNGVYQIDDEGFFAVDGLLLVPEP